MIFHQRTISIRTISILLHANIVLRRKIVCWKREKKIELLGISSYINKFISLHVYKSQVYFIVCFIENILEYVHFLVVLTAGTKLYSFRVVFIQKTYFSHCSHSPFSIRCTTLHMIPLYSS